MTNADKMFEELGYKKKVYPKDHFYYGEYKKDSDNIIVFDKDKKFYKTRRI